jgi:L-2-hydroxyglutarate oxidase LhgO
MHEVVDCVVIGAGVVGLAVAKKLASAGREVIILDRASSYGTETSSRNSEVIHAGIYYPANSLKARLCVSGNKMLYAYCQERGIPHQRLGKIIVATDASQRPVLDEYVRKAEQNHAVPLQRLSHSELMELEPEVIGIEGLFSPSTGIIDSHQLMASYLGDAENDRAVFVSRSRVLGGKVTDSGIMLDVESGTALKLLCRTVINAAGLEAQNVAHSISGIPPESIPEQYLAKGHYFSLSGRSPFRHLVYPIAEQGGLGVHVTLDMGGQARFGPDVIWIDKVDYGFTDGRQAPFLNAIRRYYPGIDAERLQPSYTGIRPKLHDKTTSFADFVIQTEDVHGVKGLINLYGIESPGLTASLAIAEYVAQPNTLTQASSAR